ncbi:MAG TPA: DUF3347 domain-containing protein [Planctomycetota bacterium]|nr:DUF3347 domain-containing protein [Planctomycetota bacterium]
MRLNSISAFAALLISGLSVAGCTSDTATPHAGTAPAAAASAPAAIPAGTEPAIAHYLEVRAALANDDLEAAKKAAEPGKSDAAPFGADETKIAGAADLKAARAAFSDLSKAMIPYAKEHASATFYVFECPMSMQPFGQWLQAEEQLKNPYRGKEMPTCGSKVDTIAKK